MKTYQGSCHCNNISFSFKHNQSITNGLRCNCSICKRKGAIMSVFTIEPNELTIVDNKDSLSLYQFDNKVAKHYFCNNCGIYPFHQTMRKPGHYRVNLGCIDELDTDTLAAAIFDGKDL